jgi:hypothetical protein
MFIAPVCFFACSFAPAARNRGALAGAAAVVLLGYWLCTLVFILAAAILFAARRRELVAENLLFAGIAFLIALFIAPMAAVS